MLFKINYWKRNALFCLVHGTVVKVMKEWLSVPERVMTVYAARLEQLSCDGAVGDMVAILTRRLR